MKVIWFSTGDEPGAVNPDWPAHRRRLLMVDTVAVGAASTVGGFSTLKEACTQCERVARYRLESLIAQHGRRFGIPMLLRRLSEDCEKRSTVTAYDLCGVYVRTCRRCFLAAADEAASD